MSTLQTRTGLIAALGAFLSWGLLPVYWKGLQHVPSYEILCHRIVWSAVFLALLLTLNKSWNEVRAIFTNPKSLRILGLSTILVSSNWFLYIWAVNAGHVVQVSLGYYICPLMNVFWGFVFFRDSLARPQWVAIGLACAGVLLQLVAYGNLPWIALSLAGTFSLYGLARKVVPVRTLPGLFFETLMVTAPAAVYLLWLEASAPAGGALFHAGLASDALLLGAGVATALPLVFFSTAAKRLKLATLGVMQYMAPTGQFLLGVFVYREPFDEIMLFSFCFIWLGVAVYALHGLRTLRAASPRHS